MLNTTQVKIYERALDAAVLRQRTIANNVANVDTPFFKSKEVVFETLLQDELARGKNVANLPVPQVISNPNVIVQNNGNSVDIEYEMSNMAKNQIWFNGLVQMTNGYFSKIKMVLQETK